MSSRQEPDKRVIHLLAKKNALLKRRVSFLEEQLEKQEKLADNRRFLLRRINEEYAQIQELLQQKNNELEAYTTSLTRSQEHLAGVLDNSPCCMSVKTLDNVYTMLNPRFEELLGIPSGSGIGRSIWELFTPEDARKIDLLTRDAQQSGGRITRELRLRVNQIERIMHVTVFPLRDDLGNIQALGSISVDLSELRRLESETLHAAQLASLGELAAGVAHEINNPLNGVMNYAQLLVDELQDMQLNTEFPQLIIHECERIAGIVHSLLDLARKPGNQRMPCNVAQLMQEVLKLMHKQLQHENMKLITDFPDSLPQVSGNPLELQQVFMNCLSNARKALQQLPPDTQGTLLVQISSPKESHTSLVRIIIEDNGPGIAPENLQRIFEPFFTTNPQGHGAGLGLSICRRIIKEHNGNISVHSQPGRTTRVVVDLPALASQNAFRASQQSSRGMAQKSDLEKIHHFTKTVSEPNK